MSGVDDIAQTATLPGAPPPVEEGADPLVGTLLDDRYRVLARLGQGGMGLVYEAEHRFLKTRVAIKLLRSEAQNDEESLERLKREARSASEIGNRHIVDVRDFGFTPDGTVYVAMERIEGIDLLKEIRKAPLSWERARHVALQVCEALGAAHARGIVHRDLKPENVLLTTKGDETDFVKIVDFGIAKIEGTEKLTMAGRVMGTPEYMSPEQCAARPVDARTDVYALGVMLYEMVTGKLPFADPDLFQIVKMQMTQAPLPPSKVRPEAELPLAFEAIVLRCMAKNPKRRFASMAEVAEALQAVDAGPADSEGQADEAARAAWAEPDLPAAIPARDTPKAVEETRRGPPTFLFVAAAVGLLGGLVASAVIVLRGEDPPAHEALARADGTAPPMASEQALATPPPRAEVASTAVTEPGAPSPPARSEILELASTPEGAEVYEDGALLGRTPLRVARPAEGERLALEVRQAGFTPHPLVLSALSADEVRISLTPAAHPRAAQPEARPPEPATEPPSGGAPPPPAQRHREFRDPWAQ